MNLSIRSELTKIQFNTRRVEVAKKVLLYSGFVLQGFESCSNSLHGLLTHF